MCWPWSRNHASAMHSAKGLRLAQAACGVGLAYAAVSVYWALGGTWLLDTVGGTLGQPGHPGLILAVWAAAVLKVIGAIVPLAATGMTPGPATSARRRQVRVLAWLEAAILTAYGLVLTVAGLLVQSGAITPAARRRSPGARLARLSLGPLVPALGSACRRRPAAVPATRPPPGVTGAAQQSGREHIGQLRHRGCLHAWSTC